MIITLAEIIGHHGFSIEPVALERYGEIVHVLPRCRLAFHQ